MHKASVVLDVLRKACPRPGVIPAISVRRTTYCKWSDLLKPNMFSNRQFPG